MADTSKPSSVAAEPSSTDMQRIFDDAQKFSAQYAGFFKVAEVIGSLGSVKQAIREAEQRLANAKVAEAEAVRQAAAKVQDLERQHLQRISDLDRAYSEREVRDTREAYQEQRNREAMIADAHKEVEAVKANAAVHEQLLAGAKQQLAEQEAAVNAKRKEYGAVLLQINEAKAALEHAHEEHQAFLARVGAR